jgi:hypothetical protein
VYFTDRGLEELVDRRGGETFGIEWLAARLTDFIDQNPEAAETIDGFATWLARLDDDEDD